MFGRVSYRIAVGCSVILVAICIQILGLRPANANVPFNTCGTTQQRVQGPNQTIVYTIQNFAGTGANFLVSIANPVQVNGGVPNGSPHTETIPLANGASANITLLNGIISSTLTFTCMATGGSGSASPSGNADDNRTKTEHLTQDNVYRSTTGVFDNFGLNNGPAVYTDGQGNFVDDNGNSVDKEGNPLTRPATQALTPDQRSRLEHERRYLLLGLSIAAQKRQKETDRQDEEIDVNRRFTILERFEVDENANGPHGFPAIADADGNVFEHVVDENGNVTKIPVPFQDYVTEEDKADIRQILIDQHKEQESLASSPPNTNEFDSIWERINEIDRQLGKPSASASNYTSIGHGVGTPPLSALGLFERQNSSTPSNLDLAIPNLGGNSRLRGWIKGNVSGNRSRQTGARRDGNAYNFNVGVAHQIATNTQIGGAVRFENSDNSSSDLGSNIDTDLFGGSLFANIRLANELTLSLIAAYEVASNDITINGATGSFDYRSTILSAALARTFTLQNGWWVQPNVSLSWSHTNRDGYTDSNGLAIAGSNFNYGIMQAGPRVGKTFLAVKNGDEVTPSSLVAVTPSFGLSGNWVFDKPADGLLANGTNLPVSDSGITFDSGIAFVFAGGASASVGGSYTAMSDHVSNWSLNAGLDLPLSSIFGGADNGARVAFHAGTNPVEIMNLRARLSMPLN